MKLNKSESSRENFPTLRAAREESKQCKFFVFEAKTRTQICRRARNDEVQHNEAET